MSNPRPLRAYRKPSSTDSRLSVTRSVKTGLVEDPDDQRHPEVRTANPGSFDDTGMRITSEKTPKAERTVALGELPTASTSKMWPDYDPGDGWEHEVVTESIGPAEAVVDTPTSCPGRRVCGPGTRGLFDRRIIASTTRRCHTSRVEQPAMAPRRPVHSPLGRIPVPSARSASTTDSNHTNRELELTGD